MVRRLKAEKPSGYAILLADDNPDYREAASTLLEREGHEVISASGGQEALDILQQRKVDLLLLDYYMPGMTGEEVVTKLRQFNPYVQVILQTGYASEQPPRQLLRRLDIQGYYDKSEGPEKLLLWTDVGLKAAYTIQLLSKSRQGLRYILDVTPDLHRIQPLEELLVGILFQVCGLLSAVDSFVALFPPKPARPARPQDEAPGFVAMVEGDRDLVIRVGTGQFSTAKRVSGCVPPGDLDLIHASLERGEILIADSATIVPLSIGSTRFGVIFLDRRVVSERDIELLHLFANQASVAIHNIQLYEMATVDPLTKVYVRRFFEQLLLRELRTAFRSQQPMVLAMADLDALKRLNDTAGHLAGDEALASVGRILNQTMRGGDIVARYGGDEFAVVLPQTTAEQGDLVAQRIVDRIASIEINSHDGPLRVHASVGVSVLEAHDLPVDAIPRPIPQQYFQEMGQLMVQRADEALYEAKRRGGNCSYRGAAVLWSTLEKPTGKG